MIAPPFTALSAVSLVVKGSQVMLGSQNMSVAESGAHTGEISINMLQDLGVKAVILGHSERRILYGESNDLVNRKVKLALSKSMEVILCVGETLEQREGGKANEVVESQVVSCLKDVASNDMPLLTIAYEPVWAIGTGKNATPEDANSMHPHIRAVISRLYSAHEAANLVIQYGGSVKPDNIKALMAKENIDGALVGGAALTIETFSPIMNA